MRDGWPLAAWRAAFLVTVGVLLWLALRPGTGEPDWFWQADKVKHASAFLVLWLLGRVAGWGTRRALALALLGFGVFIEIAQSFTPDREPSVLDVGADLVGIGLGAWLSAQPRVAAALRWLSRPTT